MTIAIESWHSALPEMEAIWPLHFAEFGVDGLCLAMDTDLYAAIDKAGKLHVTTIRNDGKLIGYHIAILATHLHHKHDLHATTDLYYIVPEHRTAWLAIKLFRFVERDFCYLGVKRFCAGTRLSKDAGVMLQRLGFKPVETIYTKVLEWKQ